MTNVIQPFHLLVIALAGWLNRQQQAVTDYLMEENRVLKEQLEGQRFRMILFGEASLRPAIREYVVHFRNERNHQGVGNRLLEPCATGNSIYGPIQCRERLGDMLNFYDREAA